MYDNVTSLAWEGPDFWQQAGFETTLVPFFYTKIQARMNDDQMNDYLDMLDSADDAILLMESVQSLGHVLFIVGIIIGVLGVACSGGALAAAPKGSNKVFASK